MASPRELARLQALGRVALGGLLVASPRLLTCTWLGSRAARQTGTRVISAGLGARDVGLGLGTARALGTGSGARPWLAAGVLADLVDLVATLRARDELPALGVVSVATLAGGSAALGVWLHTALD